MDISSITNGLSGLLSSGSSANPLAGLTGTSNSAQATAAASALGPTAQARVILAQYDVHRISPRQISELVTKLGDAGVLSPGDTQDLTQLRMEMDAQGVGADEEVDLPSFLNKAAADKTSEVEQLQSQPNSNADLSSAQTDLATINRQLGWVQKFMMVQDSPSGIQTVA